MHEPKSSFGPSAAKISLRSGNGERAADSSSRFHKAATMPATAPERPLMLSPNASAKPRVCGMRNRPSRLAGPRASRERSEPPDAIRRVLPAVMAEEYGAIEYGGGPRGGKTAGSGGTP